MAIATIPHPHLSEHPMVVGLLAGIALSGAAVVATVQLTDSDTATRTPAPAGTESVERFADPTGLGAALAVVPPARAPVADPTGLGAALSVVPATRAPVIDATGLGEALAVVPPTRAPVADPTGLGAALAVVPTTTVSANP